MSDPVVRIVRPDRRGAIMPLRLGWVESESTCMAAKNPAPGIGVLCTWPTPRIAKFRRRPDSGQQSPIPSLAAPRYYWLI